MAAQMFIVIKGSKFDAERETMLRDIEFTFEAESSHETYGHVPLNAKSKLVDWYSKDAGWSGQFQNGSLLWYAERN